MLHLGILPHHGAWAELFANLAVVVVDEAHTYRGVFGSHVANVLRRLRRIAAAYGTEPRFLLASATIANPVELAERLTGLEDVALIDRDGSPSAGRRIAIWNPPIIDEALGAAPLGARRGRRAARAAGRGRRAHDLLRALAQGRRAAHADRARRARARSGAGELRELVMPYRAGYTAAQRREIEARLSAGELRAVVTTDALELGIDVGALDASIVVTFPGHDREPAPDVGPRRPPPPRARASTSPARTRSTSSSRATPTTSSTARSSRRSSTTSPRRSISRTCSAPPTRAR